MIWVFLNGSILPKDEAHISIDDRGFLLGDGLFETMRAYEGKVFRLKAHLDRLRSSAEFLHLPTRFTDASISDAIDELIRRNERPDAYVRLTITRGREDKGLRLSDDAAPTVLIRVRNLAAYPERLYDLGMDLIVGGVRQISTSPLPRHKTLNYLPYLLARQQAADLGAHGAVILNEHGQVTEESVSNLFIVRDEKIVTPPVHCGLLPGITRAAVIEIAQQNGIVLEQSPITAGDLFKADEVFLTNSLMEVMPVRKIDKQPVGQGEAGPMARRMRRLYVQLVTLELEG